MPAQVVSTEATPVSNTGLNCLNNQNALRISPSFTVKLDTISGVCRNVSDLASARHIIDLLENTFDDRIDFDPYLGSTMGCRWDGSTKSSLRGLRVWWKHPRGTTPGQLYVYCGGQVLSAADHKSAHDVFGYLAIAFDFECKRFDSALDDYGKTITLEQIEDVAHAGDYAWVGMADVHSSGKRSQQWGKTISFGSTQSDKRLVVYDKSIESKGEIDAIRWEARYRDNKAHQIFEHWAQMLPANLDSQASSWLAEIVTGSVLFCDRSSGDAHLERCPVFPWWKAFLDKVGQGVRITVSQKKPLLDKTLEWLNRQVFPQLAVVKKVFKDGFETYLENELAGGESRHGPRHRAIIELSLAAGW